MKILLITKAVSSVTEILSFLNRDALDGVELVNKRFATLVSRRFSEYPKRRLEIDVKDYDSYELAVRCGHTRRQLLVEEQTINVRFNFDNHHPALSTEWFCWEELPGRLRRSLVTRVKLSVPVSEDVVKGLLSVKELLG
ncbi:hypothetical protein AAVH_07310 [Aphelenchoides avenae]|nr:hypothetical protein AAVH_07310 [Aphelenchus avenae]